MVNIGTGTGTLAFIDVDFEFSFKNSTLIKPKDDTLGKYLYYYFLKNKKILSEITRGGAQPFLSLKIIKSISLFFPLLAEQTDIVRILDSFFEKEKQAKELARVIEKLELMKKANLARAFRGELGTNDPNEESAEGWLREILQNQF